MKSSKFMAMAIVGIMIMLCAVPFSARATSTSATDWYVPVTVGGETETAHVNVTIGTYHDINAGTTRYFGPTFSAVRTPNGTLIIFARNATTHVGPNDYGSIDYLKSFDNGATWTGTTELTNGSIVNLDMSEATAGVTLTGRVICVYLKFDCINVSRDPQEGVLAFKYSDDNGATFSTEHVISPGIVGGKNITGICAPHGAVGIFQNGRIGFTVFSLKQSPNPNTDCRLAFVYSDDNGLTWHSSEMSTGYFYNETTIAYVGSGQMVAMTRTKDSAMAMETSVDNGATWTSRGSQYAMSNGPRGPVLVTVNDNFGKVWVLALFQYSTYFYTVGYGDYLIRDGLSAWQMPVIENDLGGAAGQAGYTLMNANTGVAISFTCSNTGTFNETKASHLEWHEIDVTIHVPGGPGTIGLPANVHQYTTLVLVMFGLVMVVTTVGFMSKAKDEGIDKDDVIELAVFLVVSLILMGVLAVMLGS